MVGLREMRDTSHMGNQRRNAFERRLREEGGKHRNLGMALGLFAAILVALGIYFFVV